MLKPAYLGRHCACCRCRTTATPGPPWGCPGLHSRDQDFAQKPKCPLPKAQHDPAIGQLWKAEDHHPTPVDKAPDSQNHHNPQWKRQEASSCHFVYKTDVCLSHHLRQPLCQVGANALLCPFFSFLCFAGSTSFGPGKSQLPL